MGTELSGGVVLQHADPDMAIGHWRKLYLLIWRDNTTVEGVDELRREFREWSYTQDGPLALLTVVQENCPLPSAEARKDLGRWLGEISDRIRASAVVYEGAGFKSASVRGVVTGLTLIARQSYPHKVFSTVREATHWLGKMAPGQGVADLTAADALAACQRLRAALD